MDPLGNYLFNPTPLTSIPEQGFYWYVQARQGLRVFKTFRGLLVRRQPARERQREESVEKPSTSSMINEGSGQD